MKNKDKLFIDSVALSLHLKDSVEKFFETSDLSKEQKNALLWATIFFVDNAIEVAEVSKKDFIEMYEGGDA
jgi:hypothetical protein